MNVMTVKRFYSVLGALALMMLAGPASADISGTWDFAVEIPGAGSGNAEVTLEDDGQGNLTGRYSGQLGDTDVTGTVDGDSFEFEVPGQMTVTYEGEQQDDGSLEGTVSLGDMGEGTFEATRQDG